MDDLKIRPLLADEEAPMALLLLADPSREAVESYLRRGRCYVGELAGQVVAVCVLIETRPHTVELVNVAVAEEEQGRGIGRRMVLHAIDVARSLGFRSIEVGTGNSSLKQLALYQRCGFRIVGVDLDFFTRHYPEPIYENGILCRDMIRLRLDL
ncbi:MAG: GNAT family N-acetyltransferase [Symbiobacterium sp.]|uniref:GNAT family N-acetyltransferase n=1 Tax=Symbiobacterium sp. TaxID=1971213 RepID=UPI003464D13F